MTRPVCKWVFKNIVICKIRFLKDGVRRVVYVYPAFLLFPSCLSFLVVLVLPSCHQVPGVLAVPGANPLKHNEKENVEMWITCKNLKEPLNGNWCEKQIMIVIITLF